MEADRVCVYQLDDDASFFLEVGSPDVSVRLKFSLEQAAGLVSDLGCLIDGYEARTLSADLSSTLDAQMEALSDSTVVPFRRRS